MGFMMNCETLCKCEKGYYFFKKGIAWPDDLYLFKSWRQTEDSKRFVKEWVPPIPHPPMARTEYFKTKKEAVLALLLTIRRSEKEAYNGQAWTPQKS